MVLTVMQDRQHIDEFIVRVIIDYMTARQNRAIASPQIGAINAYERRLTQCLKPRFYFSHIGLRDGLAPFFE